MFIYQVEISIQKDVEREWLAFMQHKHLDDVVNTGCFVSKQMYKKLADIPDGAATTYIMNYTATTQENIDSYLTNYAAALREEVHQLFGGKFSASRRILEVL